MVAMAETGQQKVVKMDPGAKPLCKCKVYATVIPAPRKSVKRMMFEATVDFVARLFSSEGNPPKKVHGCFKTKRVCSDHS